MTTRLPRCFCPGCSKPNDAASAAVDPDALPVPGDISLCFYCGHIGIYADDMSIRAPTGAEIYEIAGDPDLIAVQKARAEYWKNQERE